MPFNRLVIPFDEDVAAVVNVGVFNAPSRIACFLVFSSGLIGISCDEVDRGTGSVVGLQGGGIKTVQVSASSADVWQAALAGDWLKSAEPGFRWILAEQFQEVLSIFGG